MNLVIACKSMHMIAIMLSRFVMRNAKGLSKQGMLGFRRMALMNTLNANKVPGI